MTDDSNAQSVNQGFQIIFEKLEEAKKEKGELFFLEQPEMLDSIREIQKIVDSYSLPNTFTTFTRA